MTSHNRVLLVVGGAAMIAIFAIGAVLLQTGTADASLQADQASVRSLQALADELMTEVNEQHDALDDFLLTSDPAPLARYRAAVAAETATAERITVDASGFSRVMDALEGVDAENDAWRVAIADPAIAALGRGTSQPFNDALQIRIQDQQGSRVASDRLLREIDTAAAELSRRYDALNGYRMAASIAGIGIELAAAALSLWFVRRYGLRVARDTRRRAEASAERMTIVASLRTLRTQATPEATAALIAEALHCLPGVDVAGVFACVDDTLVALAMAGLPDFPIKTGDRLPANDARALLSRSGDGPWAEKWNPPAAPSALDLGRTTAGIKSRAFAPIHAQDELIGLIGISTTDEGLVRHLVEDLPAVNEFASVAEAILVPALMARRDRGAARQRIVAVIDAGTFHPVFQPVVDLATGYTVGFEALTRFDDGTRPDHVFAAARACGMELELEHATLVSALTASRGLSSGAWLSLNVSPTLLAADGILGPLLADAARPVVLEITEHETIDAYAPLRAAMARLGPSIRLAVDDAGAGAANFNHLVELRPNFVKIDAGLVRGVNTDPGRQAVVAGLIHFAAKAGCEVIAEGIETPAERATVFELGVTLGQGFLLARPAPATAWRVAVEPAATVSRPPRTPGRRGPHGGVWARTVAIV